MHHSDPDLLMAQLSALAQRKENVATALGIPLSDYTGKPEIDTLRNACRTIERLMTSNEKLTQQIEHLPALIVAVQNELFHSDTRHENTALRAALKPFLQA